MPEVIGPAHCEDHRAHVVGCLACAAEVCAADGLDLGDFLDEMQHIGWPICGGCGVPIGRSTIRADCGGRCFACAVDSGSCAEGE